MDERKKKNKFIQSEWAKKKRKCPLCEKEKSNSYISIHVRRMHKDAIKCNNKNCFVYFDGLDSEYKRDQHVKEVHGDFFECHDCGKLFMRQVKLRKHMALIHNKPNTNLKYNVRKKKFDTELKRPNKKFRTHFDGLDSEEKRDQHIKQNSECHFCGMKFLRKRCLKQHIKLNHLELHCDRCQDHFECYSLYLRHRREVCDPMGCLICKNMHPFQNVYLLQEHMEEQHNVRFSGIEFRNKHYYCIVCFTYLASSEKSIDHCWEELHLRKMYGSSQRVVWSSRSGNRPVE